MNKNNASLENSITKKMSTGPSLYYDGFVSYDFPHSILSDIFRFNIDLEDIWRYQTKLNLDQVCIMTGWSVMIIQIQFCTMTGSSVMIFHIQFCLISSGSILTLKISEDIRQNWILNKFVLWRVDQLWLSRFNFVWYLQVQYWPWRYQTKLNLWKIITDEPVIVQTWSSAHFLRYQIL